MLFRSLGLPNDGSFQLFRSRGCEKCGKSGYKGRAAIHELLVTSPDIKRLIQTRARATEIFAHAKQGGMSTLLQDGIMKAIAGVTDVKQVKAVANS